jgi:predicted regulator of Ras-like GTPase activity (Roadblock/LC7/MglB family)
VSATLAELLKDIRADLGADFIASDIVGMDGMSIAGEHGRGDYEAEMVAAHFAMVMKLAAKVSGEMQMGEVRENQVNTEKAMVFSRQLADTDFFWLLATSREATLGIVRSLLDEYELRIYAAIPG